MRTKAYFFNKISLLPIKKSAFIFALGREHKLADGISCPQGLLPKDESKGFSLERFPML
jgi:hypothetical protein